MFVSLSSDKLGEMQQLALALLQTQPVTVHQVMSFQESQYFCQWSLTVLMMVSCYSE